MYTIGEFSKLTWISVKALRHYDEVGILPPAAVDPQSGYRFYNEEQIQTAALIRKLRRFEFPLKTIREILESEPAEVLPILDAQIRLLERNQETLVYTIRELKDFKHHVQEYHMSSLENTQENNTATGEYIVENSPELRIIAARQTIGIDQIGSLYSKLFEEAVRRGIQPNGITGIRYYDDEFDRDHSDMEVFIGVDRPNYIIPPTKCLKTVHQGPYSTLEDTYALMMQEIHRNDYRISGAPFEIYRVNQFNSPDPSDWLTDIYFPIA